MNNNTNNNFINKILIAVSERADLTIGIMLLVGVSIMLIPLPTWMMDGFIAINLGFTLLVLMVAFYVKSPLELSAFPSIILLATLFRLALSISSTRLILLNADAGHIIQSFGEFVIAGSVAVGIIVFILITIVQFVVVTKGAERIAEVAARFTLDALPGKQIAIDADLRSGDLSKEDAKFRRAELGRESQFYGAMDGAMKFVKGDAIAGIIIVIVNLIGGISIGVVGKGLDFSNAVNTYSLLSIGDGLVSQIPSLLIAMAAGSVVTRVNSEQNINIGTDISKQLTSDWSALAMAAGAMLLASFLPGFPTIIFLILAAALGFGAFMVRKRLKDKEEALALSKASEEKALAEANENAASASSEIAYSKYFSLKMGKNLWGKLDENAYIALQKANSEKSSREIGIFIPPIKAELNEMLGDNRIELTLEGLRVFAASLGAADGFTNLDENALKARNIEPLSQILTSSMTSFKEISVNDLAKLSNEEAMDFTQFLNEIVGANSLRWASNQFGTQETMQLLTSYETNYPELVKDVRANIPMWVITDVFKQLIDDGIGLSSMRLILEAFIRNTQYASSVDGLTSAVRASLSRHISQRYADDTGEIPAIILRDDAELFLRMTGAQSNNGKKVLTPQQSRKIKEAFDKALDGQNSKKIVLLASQDIRNTLKHLTNSIGITMPVLSYSEIAPENQINVVGTVALN